MGASDPTNSFLLSQKGVWPPSPAAFFIGPHDLRLRLGAVGVALCDGVHKSSLQIAFCHRLVTAFANILFLEASMRLHASPRCNHPKNRSRTMNTEIREIRCDLLAALENEYLSEMAVCGDMLAASEEPWLEEAA